MCKAARIAFVLSLAAPLAALPAAADTPPASAQAAASGESMLSLNRNLTVRQAAFAVRLKCLQDFRQCQRTIPGAALWSNAGYDLEYTGCCTEFGACVDLVESLDRRLAERTDELYSLACSYDDAAAQTSAGERREALREGARNRQRAEGRQAPSPGTGR